MRSNAKERWKIILLLLGSYHCLRFKSKEHGIKSKCAWLRGEMYFAQSGKVEVFQSYLVTLKGILCENVNIATICSRNTRTFHAYLWYVLCSVFNWNVCLTCTASFALPPTRPTVDRSCSHWADIDRPFGVSPGICYRYSYLILAENKQKDMQHFHIL